ncbi:MAG: ABC transporter permease [Planctomycetota bacterium]
MILRDRRLQWGLAAAVLLVLTLFVLYPQTVVLRESLSVTGTGAEVAPPPGAATHFGWRQFGLVLTDPSYVRAIVNSVWISLVSVLLAALIGVPAAFLVDRVRFPGRRLLLVAAVLPLALPPLVGVAAFFDLLSSSGMLAQMIRAWTGWEPSLSGWAAVLVVHAYSFSVYFFALTRAGLGRLDPTQEFAAASLGASFSQRLRRILLPALRPYLVAAALLTFMTSMSSFTAPYIFELKNYMTVAIFTANRELLYERAAALATILSFVNVGFLIALQFGFGSAWRALGGGSKGETAPPLRLQFASWRTRLALLGGSLVFTLAMLLPFAVIVVEMLADRTAWNAAGTALPPVWTTAHMTWLVQSSEARAVIFTSVLATGIAVVGNLILAFGAALMIVRGSRLVRLVTDLLCMLPLALPGTVIAFNLLRAFANPSWLTLGFTLPSTLAILVLAYFIRQVPLAVRPVVASMAQVDPIFELAAQGLGANVWTIFRRVLVPQLWPGVLAAALLCTVAGLGEYVASVMLFSANAKPISIEIAQLARNPATRGDESALALLLVILTLLVLLAYAWLTRPRQR